MGDRSGTVTIYTIDVVHMCKLRYAGIRRPRVGLCVVHHDLNDTSVLIRCTTTDVWKTVGNVVWSVLCGWWVSLAYLIVACILAITVVGFPHAKVCVALAQYYFWPFGKFVAVITVRDTKSLRRCYFLQRRRFTPTHTAHHIPAFHPRGWLRRIVFTSNAFVLTGESG